MTVFQPAYRARVFAPKSVDPTETTLLTPRAGALHSDPFRVATIPGVTGYQPIMALPSGRRGRVDPKSKKTDIGARSVTLLDVLIDPASSLRTERWLTQFWGDAGGKTALGMCRYEEDESLNGGITWSRIFTGRVTDLKTKGTLQSTLSVKDTMEELEGDIFAADPLDVAYASRVPLLPSSLTTPFLGFAAGTPPLPGTVIAGSSDFPLTFQTTTDIQSLPRVVTSNMLVTQRVVDRATDTQRFASLSAVYRVFNFPVTTVRVRLDVAGAVSWWWLRAITAQRNRDDHFVPVYLGVAEAPELNAGAVTWPANGTDFTWELHYPSAKTAEANPLIIAAVDPVQLMMDILDGLFGVASVGGGPVDAVPRAAGSFEAMLGVFPPVRFIVTEVQSRRKWLAEHLCQAFQLAVTMNAFGEAVLLDLRRGTAEGLPQITDTEIVAGTDTESGAQDTGDAVRRIIAKIATVEQLDWLKELVESEEEYPNPPPGLFRVTIADPPPVYDALGDPRAIDFGANELAISFLGLATLAQSSQPTPLLFLEYTQRLSYVERYARDILDLDSHGAQYITLDCRRVGVAESTHEGDRRIIATSKLPNAGTLLRGGARVGLCIERSENGPTVTLTFKDLGLSEVSDPPTVDPPASDEETCADTVSLTVTLNAAGDPVDGEYAITATAGSRPDDSSSLWRVGGTRTTNGTLVITGLPSNSRIHLRIRSRPSGAGPQPQPSAWVAPDPAFIDTCAIEGPSDCTLAGVLVSWTLTRIDLLVRISLDGVVLEILPAGTTQWSAVGYSGTVTVDQLDRFGGVVAGCSVVVDLEDTDCIDTTFHDIPIQGSLEGSLATVLDADPHGRFQALAFAIQPGDGVESAFEPGTLGTPVTVPIVGDLVSYITRRLTVRRCSGETVDLTERFAFTAADGLPPPDDPPPGAVTAVPVPVLSMLEDRVWTGAELGAGPTTLGVMDWVDFATFAAARLTAQVRESTLGGTPQLIARYENDDGNWVRLNEDNGPALDLSAAAVALWPDGLVDGLAVSLNGADGRPLPVRQRRRVRFEVEGGDGTGRLVMKLAVLWCTAGASVQPPIEQPPLPECTVVNISLDGYANVAAMLADDWFLYDSTTLGPTVDFDLVPTPELLVGTQVLRSTANGDFLDGQGITLRKLIPGFVVGAPYHVAHKQYEYVTSPWGPPNQWNQTAGFDFSGDGDGKVLVSLGFVASGNVTVVDQVIHHDRLQIVTPACVDGNGDTPDETPEPPGNPGPQDPPPPPGPPPPAPAGSIYGMEEIPATGYPGAPWNSTVVKDLTPANAVAKIAAMRSAGMRNFFMPQGGQGGYRPNGIFSINLFVRQVRRWAPSSAGRDAVLEAIDDSTLPWAYAMDEPRLEPRWGPGGISLADMRTSVAVIQEVFPNIAIVVRATPDAYDEEIPGLTAFWAAIKPSRMRDLPGHLLRAAQLGAGLGCSFNDRDFNDSGDLNAQNNPSGWITPAQYRAYMQQLVAYGDQLLFHYGWWMNDPEWYTDQAGMAAAVSDGFTAWNAVHP